jgi:hypothetical protein
MNISLVSGVGIDDEDGFVKCRQREDLRLGIEVLRGWRNLIIFEGEKMRLQ